VLIFSVNYPVQLSLSDTNKHSEALLLQVFLA